jgi:hypothetical protein
MRQACPHRDASHLPFFPVQRDAAFLVAQSHPAIFNIAEQIALLACHSSHASAEGLDSRSTDHFGVLLLVRQLRTRPSRRYATPAAYPAPVWVRLRRIDS